MVETMGTVFSLDVRGGEPGAVRAALEEAAAGLRRVDEVFSTYREDTQISRLARGELETGQCDPEVAEVLELAAEAERISEGWFSTRYRGELDPTGIVKGWATERAARRLLAAGATGVSVAVATSGTAERGDHIVDPRTGRSAVTDLVAVTVVAPRLTWADCWATAAFAMGSREGLRWLDSLPDTEALLITAGDEVRCTAHLARWLG